MPRATSTPKERADPWAFALLAASIAFAAFSAYLFAVVV